MGPGRVAWTSHGFRCVRKISKLGGRLTGNLEKASGRRGNYLLGAAHIAAEGVCWTAALWDGVTAGIVVGEILRYNVEGPRVRVAVSSPRDVGRRGGNWLSLLQTGDSDGIVGGEAPF